MRAHKESCPSVPQGICEAVTLGWTPSVTPGGREIDIFGLKGADMMIARFDELYREMIRYVADFQNK